VNKELNVLYVTKWVILTNVVGNAKNVVLELPKAKNIVAKEMTITSAKFVEPKELGSVSVMLTWQIFQKIDLKKK
jgi:hypothetical protein